MGKKRVQSVITEANRKTSLQYHMDSKHAGCVEVFKNFQCLMCANVDLKLKPCPHCLKMFTHKMDVDKHINAIYLQIQNKHCQF